MSTVIGAALEKYAAPYAMPAAERAGAAGARFEQGADPNAAAAAVGGAEETDAALGVPECQTCKERKYQDGSDDPGVSFKSPTKISPGMAASAVAGHEMEHYTRNKAKAEEEGREVVSNDIQIFTSVCPECGKTYVSGGLTTTVTRAKEEQGELAKQFFDQTLGGSRAQAIDQKK